MSQYRRIKSAHPDELLFFQLGDFYELFYEDATRAAGLLDLTLTSRGTSQSARVPMCGVPKHAAESYLAKLLRRGESVAICDQLEEPQAGKGPVARKVTRVLTPGTLVEDAYIEQDSESGLLAISEGPSSYGISYLSLASGDFQLGEIEDAGELTAEVARFNPSEVLVPEGYEFSNLLAANASVQELDQFDFDSQAAQRRLCAHFSVDSLSGFGCENMPQGVAAAGAVLRYAERKVGQNATHINGLRISHKSDRVHLDAVTRRALEIDMRPDGSAAPTLYSIMNATCTAMGARRLRQWLRAPSRVIEEVLDRQAAISEILHNHLDDDSSRLLSEFGDTERIVSRLALRSATPRDLVKLRHSLSMLPEVRRVLAETTSARLLRIIARCPNFERELELLRSALVEDPPALLRDGGYIAQGYDAELDRLRGVQQNAQEFLQQLEADERLTTGNPSLKVGYNRVHGYYIEVSRAANLRVPDNYVPRQTLKNAQRYTTPELREFESEALSSESRALALEASLYQELINKLQPSLPGLKEAASAIAELDALQSLAERARRYGFCAPAFVKERGITYKGGWHPVVAEYSTTPFIRNDLRLDGEASLFIVTGPNMGGKSTYMRQTALIALLAHIGSWVPAEEASIGPIDAIFTRIGASDDLTQGRSTFMTEMSETANLLHNASSQSLVLIDEIGRGTSTYDGLALAFAIARYLATKCRSLCLFATHYFELTALAEAPGIHNVHLSATEHQKEVVFLYKVNPGPASRSYGIEVAKRAGVPESVLTDARRELGRLESRIADSGTNEPNLFDGQRNQAEVSEHIEKLLDTLSTLNADTMSPREAHSVLYELIAAAEHALLNKSEN